MGRFYTNVTVKHSDAEDVARAVAPLNHFAVIAPPVNGFVVVYDRASERQDGTIIHFARTLSQQLETLAFAVMNHDDDILFYWLFDRGTEVDKYNSCPWYFLDSVDPLPQGGNANTLASLLGRSEAVMRVDHILHCDADPGIEGPYTSQTDRHEDLVEVLRLPEWAVGYGYNYLADDDLPHGFPVDDTYFTEEEGANAEP
jgi:hypothetical protein